MTSLEFLPGFRRRKAGARPWELACSPGAARAGTALATTRLLRAGFRRLGAAAARNSDKSEAPAGFRPDPGRPSLAFLTLIAAVVLLLAAGCARPPAPEEPPPTRVEGHTVVLPADSPQRQSLTVAPATERTVRVTHLTGRLVWDDSATVRVFSPVAGRVTALDVGLGQPVEAGAVLARVSSPDFGQAQADVRKANADLVLAERNLKRLRELQAHGAAAQKDVEAAEDTQAAALAEQERAAARLALYGGTADVLDGLYVLRAPIAGTVVERNLSPGQEIRPDQMLGNVPPVFSPLVTISDPTKLWLWVDATESDINVLKAGQQIQLHAKPYGDREFPGRLDVIGDALDPQTRTVKVRGSVPNPDRLLKAEMYVTVDIVTEVPPTPEVEAKAVFLKDTRAYAFVEDAPGRFTRRELKTGTEDEGKVAVLEGLKAGERVVTEGCLLLESALESKGNP